MPLRKMSSAKNGNRWEKNCQGRKLFCAFLRIGKHVGLLSLRWKNQKLFTILAVSRKNFLMWNIPLKEVLLLQAKLNLKLKKQKPGLIKIGDSTTVAGA